MGTLFGVKTPAINRHLKRIFEEGELQEKEVVSKMEITTRHGSEPHQPRKSIALADAEACAVIGIKIL